jgi:hypothetical protein
MRDTYTHARLPVAQAARWQPPALLVRPPASEGDASEEDDKTLPDLDDHDVPELVPLVTSLCLRVCLSVCQRTMYVVCLCGRRA